MADSSILRELSEVLVERKRNPPTKPSYVVKLLQGGTARIGSKILEEAAEVIEAGEEAGASGAEHLVKEVSDLVFHAMVLLTQRDVPWSAVESELGRRFGIGGIDEKSSRPQTRPPG